MVRWVVGSVLLGGPIQLNLVPAKGTRCSSMVRAFTHGSLGRSFMVDPLSYFSFNPRERDVALCYEHSLMVRWVVGSIFHGVDPLSYFLFHPRERDLAPG